MNIHSLKIFCDVIDTCSFSETAQMNFVTQSAVSQQINMLEKKYNDQLFIRGKNRFDLTPAGSILYRYSKEILNRYEAIENEIMFSKNIVSGMIKISTIYSIGLHELPPIVKDFMIKYPSINLNIQYSRMNKVLQDVVTGAVDLGIVAFPKKDQHLDILPFKKDQLICICGANHRFANRKTVALSDLNGETFIGFDHDIPTSKTIQQTLLEHHVRVQELTTFDNIETIKRAVEIESGISIVPKITVKKEVELGYLHAIDFEDFVWERPLGILLKSGRDHQNIVKIFTEFLQKSGQN